MFGLSQHAERALALLERLTLALEELAADARERRAARNELPARRKVPR